MKVSATVKEAVADAKVEISQEEHAETPKRVWALPDLEQTKTADRRAGPVAS